LSAVALGVRAGLSRAIRENTALAPLYLSGALPEMVTPFAFMKATVARRDLP